MIWLHCKFKKEKVKKALEFLVRLHKPDFVTNIECVVICSPCYLKGPGHPILVSCPVHLGATFSTQVVYKKYNFLSKIIFPLKMCWIQLKIQNKYV